MNRNRREDRKEHRQEDRKPDRRPNRVPAEDRTLITRRRAGLSLLELVICMSMSVIVVGWIAKQIYSMLHAQKKVHRIHAQQNQLARLRTCLAGDIHAARAATVTATGELDLRGDRTIRYESSESRLARMVSVADDPHSKDAFFLDSDAKVEFKLLESDGTQFVLVQFLPAANALPDRLKTLGDLRFRVGSDHRFSPPEVQE